MKLFSLITFVVCSIKSFIEALKALHGLVIVFKQCLNVYSFSTCIHTHAYRNMRICYYILNMAIASHKGTITLSIECYIYICINIIKPFSCMVSIKLLFQVLHNCICIYVNISVFFCHMKHILILSTREDITMKLLHSIILY